MRVQWAWLELCDGTWYLLTDINHDYAQASQKWADEDIALAELIGDGWTIDGIYPNQLSDMLNLGQDPRGYGLIRTIH